MVFNHSLGLQILNFIPLGGEWSSSALSLLSSWPWSNISYLPGLGPLVYSTRRGWGVESLSCSLTLIFYHTNSWGAVLYHLWLPTLSTEPGTWNKLEPMYNHWMHEMNWAFNSSSCGIFSGFLNRRFEIGDLFFFKQKSIKTSRSITQTG